MVGLGQFEFCVVHRDGRLRLTYRGFLLRHTRGKPRNAGLGGSDLCLCRIHRNDEIPIVDRGEQIACLHWLVFFDQDFADHARHLGRDEGEIGLYIGVVRGLGRCAGFGAIQINDTAHCHCEE